MKKIKLIAPMLSVAALGSIVAPIATSCGCSQRTTYIVPTDTLNIVGHTLKGFGKKTDFDKFVDYTTLMIPDSVKFIDDGAFKDVMTIGKKSGFIDTVIVPNTVKEIRTDSFVNCDSVKVLDFSTWTATEIYQLQVTTDAFKGCSNIGKVILNENLSSESKDKIKSLLVTGGLNPMWFAQESTDKVTADSAWMSQKIEEGSAATYLFKLNVEIKPATQLYATVVRTNGTKGVNIKATSNALNIRTDNIIEVPVSLVDATKTDEYADFSIIITALSDIGGEQKALWSQTVTGFKLSNIHTDTPEPKPEPTVKYDLIAGFTPIVDTTTTGPLEGPDIETFLKDSLANNSKIFIEGVAGYLQTSIQLVKEYGTLTGIDSNEPIGYIELNSFEYNKTKNTVNFNYKVSQHYIATMLGVSQKYDYDFDITVADLPISEIGVCNQAKDTTFAGNEYNFGILTKFPKADDTESNAKISVTANGTDFADPTGSMKWDNLNLKYENHGWNMEISNPLSPQYRADASDLFVLVNMMYSSAICVPYLKNLQVQQSFDINGSKKQTQAKTGNWTEFTFDLTNKFVTAPTTTDNILVEITNRLDEGITVIPSIEKTGDSYKLVADVDSSLMESITIIDLDIAITIFDGDYTTETAKPLSRSLIDDMQLIVNAAPIPTHDVTYNVPAGFTPTGAEGTNPSTIKENATGIFLSYTGAKASTLYDIKAASLDGSKVYATDQAQADESGNFDPTINFDESKLPISGDINVTITEHSEW